MFENYKDSLFNDKIILRSQQRFRSDHHRVYTEEVNKISLSSNDDKIQTYDKITTYPYGTNIFKICENEMLLKNKFNGGLNNNNNNNNNNNIQALRNKSKALVDESQELVNKSQKLINKSQALRNKLIINKNKSHKLINELQALINKSQALRNDSEIT